MDFLQSYVTDRPASIDPGSIISPTALPGPSTSSDAVDARPIVSLTPEQVQPFPKAEARKRTGKKRGKQPGRTKITTDTPEKNEIKKQKQKKMLEKRGK